MLHKREKRAFWLFLLWMAIMPFMQYHHLAAQDDDLILDDAPVADTADVPAGSEPLPDAAAASATADGAGEVAASDTVAAEPAADQPADSADAAAEPDAAGEGEGEGEEAAAKPALSADPNVLLGKVNGLSKAGKHQEVIAELQEFEDAVVENTELLAIYVEALIKIDKPDWNVVNRVARVLGSRDNSSSLANYAQGLYWEKSKKPDMGKAVTFYGKARTAKIPYPGAAGAYYIGMLKRFWYVLLLVVALPVVAVIQKKKKQKAAQLVELNLDLAGQGTATAANPETAPASPDSQPGAAAAVSGPAVDKSTPTTAQALSAAVKPDAPSVAAGEGATSETKPANPVTKKVVKVVRKVKTVARPKDADEEPEETRDSEPAAPAVYPPRKPAVQPAAAPVYDSITAKHQAEIERIRELTRPERRPSVQADPELDVLWGNLSRKALQGRIAPQYRRSDAYSSARGTAGSSSGSYKDAEPDFNTSDVSIDLSDEALRDDLIGKLKMLAITDGELRELFAMKNGAHIPHLIEYIMTRPEPLRLALVAREIGHYGDPAVIDTLASLLYHDDERVALAAINGLENSKKPAAVLHLCPFLQAETPILAQAARTALLGFGAVKILQAFKNLPDQSDEKIKVGGVFVLSRMKGNAVEELLKKMLHDDALEVRSKTILAMSYQKNPVYIEPLREFFRIAAESDKAMARKAIVYLQGFVSRGK
ncbi:MAG TPA: HEAT repeat domain-containing protein [Candidatus Rifleibacterium sp.]|nr:HEAT repeat domain-containing protein [Candidatus Rifleibacterium sp.]HPT46889.1 HEAT repeat domain-containing protein [Candidatus Rifleibacterium sp.]